MGQMTQTRLRAFQEQTGIQPAHGEYAEALRSMSQAAYELIQIIEAERSGIRDGDGLWHGSDPLEGAVQNIARLDKRAREIWCEQQRLTADPRYGCSVGRNSKGEMEATYYDIDERLF